MSVQLWLPLLCLLAALLLTGAVRRYALGRQLLDIPGARSSHHTPTPRGGGLAIALTVPAALLALQALGELDPAPVIALCGAGMAVAVIGFVDDHRHVPAHWRLLVHAAAAVWALLWLDSAPGVELPALHFGPAGLSTALLTLALAWLLNLYNFMDGIDGLASAEAVCTALGGGVLFLVAGRPGEATACFCLAAAAAGFLRWNLPPARIFLGDVGSGFLGITLGVLALHAASLAPQLLWSWLILLGVFVVDASITLLRRLIRGERVAQAHRSHAYQHAAQRFGHGPVTATVTAINLLWLLPIALLVGIDHLAGWPALLIAYAPLVVLAGRFSAGLAQTAPTDDTNSDPSPR